MNWDERVWKALLRAAAYIPPTVRMEAVLSIIEESEKIAKSRGSNIVEEEDLVKAVVKRVPKAYKRISLKILSECGINISLAS